MPVIGRLDGQVEEVIISPISRRPRDEEGPRPVPQNEETPEPSDAPDHAPSQTPHADESSANAGELPVWLL
ncbi:MAG TPA: hypothetical protein VF591_07530 [Pyrinomonadaceae bacterium]|jgi:hypothetical protein